MDSYQIVLKAGRGVTSGVVADLSRYLTSAVARWGERGCETLDATANLPRNMAEALSQRTGALFAAVCVNASVVWSGHVEELSVTGSEVRLRAVGGWMALEKERYTELWSTRDYNAWEIVDANSSSYPLSVSAGFEFLTDNMLMISPTQGSTHGNAPYVVGFLGAQTPSGSSRTIKTLSLTYSFTASAPWTFGVRSYSNRDWSSTGESQLLANLAGNGATQSATVSYTPNSQGVSVLLWYDAANATYTGVTRAVRAQITNIRITTTTSSTVIAQEVIRDILARASSTLIDNGTTALIGNTTVDINELLFEDETLSQAIRRVEAMGNSTGDPWRCWIDDRHAMRFEAWPAVTGLPDIIINSNMVARSWSNANAASRAYLTYTDANGRTARTTPVADATYLQRLGFQSTAQASVNTNNSSQLTTLGSTLLKAAQPTGRQVLGLTAQSATTAGGGRLQPWQVRVGQRCLANSSHTGDAVQFVVGAVEWDIIDRSMTLTAFDPLNRLYEQVQVTVGNERPGEGWIIKPPGRGVGDQPIDGWLPRPPGRGPIDIAPLPWLPAPPIRDRG